MGFNTRVAGPATLSRGCWVGFRFFIPSLLLSLAALALLASASPAAASTASPACDPQVAELGAVPFWENYNDFLERRLTVDESLSNTGGCLPCLLRLAEVYPSDGVILETSLPVDLGEIQPAENTTVRMKFRVPAGVSRFQSRARFICGQPAPMPTPQPVASGQMTITPSFAWANEGCPVIPPVEMPGNDLPEDLGYSARLFTATLTDENGEPVPGKDIGWKLSDSLSFRILASTGVTDAQGQATALVTPPQYFICIAPYFDRGVTQVTAASEDLIAGNATFVYTRCAPPAF